MSHLQVVLVDTSDPQRGPRARHVTPHVSGLSFTKTAPGGDATALLRLDLPPTDFPSLGPADRVVICDPRTARPVWSGYVKDLGVSRTGFDMAIEGGRVLASDESRALVYRDTGLEKWVRNAYTYSTALTQPSSDPLGTVTTPLLQTQFQPGSPIPTNASAQLAYRGFSDAGMQFGAIELRLRSGKIDSGYRTYLTWAGGFSALWSSVNINTTASTTQRRVVGAAAGHPPAGVTEVALSLQRTGGATNIADENTYTLWYEIAITGRRMDRYGTLLTGMAGMGGSGNIPASWVVEDLLGRVLKECDPAASVIEATTAPIDQLAYHEAVKAATVLDDLSMWEPGHTWMIKAPRTVVGKHRLHYAGWGDEPRYVITAADQFELSGSEADLCNRIAVTWTDPNGRQRVETVTASVPDLGSRVRDAEGIELPVGVGSQAAAQAVGAAILAESSAPPKAGKATVARRIVDRATGLLVAPHEIEPGCMAWREETGDSLRVTEVAYDDESGAATLSLGSPALTRDQRLARLARQGKR